MLERLRKGLFFTPTDKLMTNLNVNKEHTLLRQKYFSDLIKSLQNEKCKNEILNWLYKNFHNQNVTIRIKVLVVFHICLRNEFDEEFIDVIDRQEIMNKKKSEMGGFFEENVINFYLMYLKKICINADSVKYIKKKPIKEDNAKMISHGFKILNLMNYILTSQNTFNKMGRYYQSYDQIVNMFTQFLQDLESYNIFIKRTINIVLEVSKSKQLQLTGNCGSFITQHEQIKHYFLYINEAQTVSDRLYQFYYNRYYYKKTRQMISYPSFLNVDMKDYNNLKDQTKICYKQLVKKIRNSKYENRTYTEANINKTNLTQTDTKIQTQSNQNGKSALAIMQYQFRNEEVTEDVE